MHVFMLPSISPQLENQQLWAIRHDCIHFHTVDQSYTVSHFANLELAKSFQLQQWDLIYIPFLSGLRFLRAMQFIRLADILQYLGIIHSRYDIRYCG